MSSLAHNQLANFGSCAVVVEHAGTCPNMRCSRTVIAREQFGRRCKEGKVEVNIFCLVIQEVERLEGMDVNYSRQILWKSELTSLKKATLWRNPDYELQKERTVNE